MLCSDSQCTGCAACYCTCRQEAIRMVENEEGFVIPVVDEKTCTSCGLCRKVCPILTDKSRARLEEPHVYAAWSVDESIRTKSSSGGIFSVLARDVLNRNGVVFGAAFDDKLNLRHCEAKCNTDLAKMRGSKYLQSKTGSIFIKVEKYLDQGVPVMFVGTPCQIAGLYGYLKEDYVNLITCDLVCHGVPSQSFFDQYLQYLRTIARLDVQDVSFRDGTTWRKEVAVFDFSAPKAKTVVKGLADYYLRAFMHNFVSRRSCYECKFARLPRMGDLTLGDFWGIGNDISFPYDITQGVSLLLVNSKYGTGMIEACRNELFLEERQVGEAKKMNRHIYMASEYPPERDVFLKDMRLLSIEEMWKKYRLKTKNKLALRGIVSLILRFVFGASGVAFVKNRVLRRENG